MGDRNGVGGEGLMLTQNWIYDAIIYIYALSLLFYFSDFAQPNRSAKRMGTGLLLFVWGLQTIFLASKLIEQPAVPLLSVLEFMFLLSWLLVTISLLISFFFKIEYIVFIVNVIGFAVLLLNLFSSPIGEQRLEHWQIVKEILILHVAFAIISFAAFTIGTIFSGMYMYLHRKLKDKQWDDSVRRLPSLEKIDRYANLSIMVGTPLLILSLAVAVSSIYVEEKLNLLLDVKVLLTFVAAICYVYYIIKRVSLKTTGYRLARWALLAYALMVLNFAVNSFSTFHHWIWE
ncbi:cytochrome C assembly family protein [Paenibacillus guangzhouensis]|uniref:cytochrome C assembly family protein n=1 Tax=Paenibacillus guangzhouensis TaxID=1473112 RepID=UPI002AB29AD5|nr:cytochrome c biogenesis protein CcsA [Paenibacillus guangzhouensis]